MDSFDHNDHPMEQVPSEAPASEAPSAPYSGTGAGRKESPYADSPYVTYEQPQYYQEPPKPKKQKKPAKPGTFKRILAVVLVVAVLGGVFAAEYFLWQSREQEQAALRNQINQLQSRIAELETGKPSAPGSSGASRPADGTAMTPAQLYEACVDSVVSISTTVRSQSFYGTSEGTSSGSGFILSEDGYVVTNYHVVQGATAIDVILYNGDEYEATLVGSDSTNDLAVLKVEAQGLSAASLGDSVNIGDMVAAIGNPLGELAATQTVGYVCGVGREVTTDNTIISMIQTDAAINPGNSGGPLFNRYGQVVGITTAKYSGTTGSGATIEGIGFAIPIGDVMNSISDLVDYGYVTGAYLGVTVQNVDSESASYYNLPVGAYVVTVVEDGAADRAGIQEKDIIIDLGGYKVSSITDLTRALRNFKADETTTITVIRGGQERVLDITLDEKPQDLEADKPQGEGDMPSDGSYDEWYDFFFGPNGG